MKNSIKKFLEFNGKDILFLSIDSKYWVALKPICEALGVNWSRQLRTLKNHKILGQLWSLQTMVGSDNSLREMVALPEKYVYGWLFGINSNVDALQEYQFKCFDILYEYFHGTIGQRHSILSKKANDQEELNDLEKQLNADPRYLRINDLKASIARSGKELKELDQKLVQQQLDLFNN